MKNGVFFGSSIGFFKGSEKASLFFRKHLYSPPSFNPTIGSAFGSIPYENPVRGYSGCLSQLSPPGDYALHGSGDWFLLKDFW